MLTYRRQVKVQGQAQAQAVRALIGEQNGRLEIVEIYDKYGSLPGEPKWVTICIPLPNAVHYGDESNNCEARLWERTRPLKSPDFDENFLDGNYRLFTDDGGEIGRITLSPNRREERDSIDGYELHCGDGIEILRFSQSKPPVASTWLGGRYEVSRGSNPEALFCINTWTGEMICPIPANGIFRVPQSK